MRKPLLTAVFLSFSFAYAQMGVDIMPYSSVANLSSSQIHHVVLAQPNMELIAAEDKIEEANKGRYRMGVHQTVNHDLFNSGTWETLPGGDRVWRFKITSTGALATFLYFDQFYMPAGARMHVYNEDKSEIIGAFTSYNNSELANFATHHVMGETCIVEYYEPVNVSGQGIIHINEVGHAYRAAQPESDGFSESPTQRDIQAADICEVDIKCPEGNAWWQQRNGVVRIRIKIGAGTYWCSGAVVNNTSEDCTPYVLSAWHCGEGSSVSDRNQWIFYFNYQRANCGSGSVTSNAMTGCTMPACSNDGGGASGSDFMLCLLNNPITATYAPYYNGWDASGTGSSSGVSIHHPAGDVKKISTYSTNLVNSSWGGTPGTHWRVNWVQTTTNWGVTEGGSSGSPIFNSTGKIIGTLTGGGSYCDGGPNDPNGSQVNQDDPDYYGKMSYHWTSNANPTGGHLKQYLDPTNTGLTTMGAKNNCGNLGQEEFDFDVLISIYPNPATDFIYVESSTFNKSQLAVAMYDASGKLVYSATILPNHKIEPIAVKNMESGMYLITLNDGERTSSKKIMIQH
jgi:hypothetical protein